jgi:hypothetical protein
MVPHAATIARSLHLCAIGFLLFTLAQLLAWAVGPIASLVLFLGVAALTIGWLAVATGVVRCGQGGRAAATAARWAMVGSVSFVGLGIGASAASGRWNAAATICMVASVAAYVIGMALGLYSVHRLASVGATPLEGRTRWLAYLSVGYIPTLVVTLFFFSLVTAGTFGGTVSLGFLVASQLPIAGLHVSAALICLRTAGHISAAIGGAWNR